MQSVVYFTSPQFPKPKLSSTIHHCLERKGREGKGAVTVAVAVAVAVAATGQGGGGG